MSLSNLQPELDKLGNDLANPRLLWESKVGYDSANKRMIARIAYALHEVVGLNIKKPNWSNVVRYMFELEQKPIDIEVNGYYTTIRTILKDIKVIKYKGKRLVKAENWDRFFSEHEDWSWFITDTNSGGHGGQIIK